MDRPKSTSEHADVSELRIRTASARDIPQIRQIDLSATRKFAAVPGLADLFSSVEQEGGVDEPTVIEWMSTGHIYAISTSPSGEEILGFIAFVPLTPAKEIIYLAELGVHFTLQGRGLGAKLVQALLDFASASASRVVLMTYADIAWNGPWYHRRFGFTEIPVDQVYVEVGEAMAVICAEDREKLERPGWRRSCMLWTPATSQF